MQSPARYFLKIDERFSFSSDNPEYGRMIDRIRTIAGTDLPVLIVGKPGSGKDIVARAIHVLSGRKGQLVSVNCAALSLHLIESELFGHVKGAFSDAKQDRTGRFTIASDGTLFLDEICHMPSETQAKLLRVVESGDYCPVGSDHALQSSARIVSAVNLDLGRAIADGSVDTLWCAAFFKGIKEQDLLQSTLESLKRDRHSNGAWGKSRRDMSRIPVTGLLGLLFPEMIEPTTETWLLDEWRKELASSSSGVCANYKAAYVLFALSADHAAAPELRNWLADQAEADGGWGPWHGHPIGSQTLYTALAILALNGDWCGKTRAARHAGARFLCETQKSYGLWPCHHIDEGSAWAWRALQVSCLGE